MAEARNASLELSCSKENAAVHFQDSRKFVAMANIVAPQYEVSEEKRAPLNLIAVIDKSGSMSGEKIDLVKKTIEFVLTQLQARDRLSVVTFSDNAVVEFGLTRMDAGAKADASVRVKRISTDGSTNLSGGLFAGLEQVRKSKISSKEVTSVLLLTDGEANRGITDPTQLLASLEQLLKTISVPVSIYTMGYGASHNESLLKSLAGAAHGLYYFLADEEKIAESFADCLGGLVSVVAQNIQLTVKPLSGVNGVRLLGSGLRNTQRTLPDGTEVLDVNVGDLCSEEVRNILCEFYLPAITEPASDWGFVQFTLSYINVISAAPETLEVRGAIDRPAELTDAQKATDPRVDEQRNRIAVATALEEGRRVAAQGDFARAQRTVQEAITSVKSTVSAASPVSAQLVTDLNQCLDDMENPADYRAQHAKKWASVEASHMMQRGAGPASEVYRNTTKTKMVTKSKNFF